MYGTKLGSESKPSLLKNDAKPAITCSSYLMKYVTSHQQQLATRWLSGHIKQNEHNLWHMNNGKQKQLLDGQ